MSKSTNNKNNRTPKPVVDNEVVEQVVELQDVDSVNDVSSDINTIDEIIPDMSVDVVEEQPLVEAEPEVVESTVEKVAHIENIVDEVIQKPEEPKEMSKVIIPTKPLVSISDLKPASHSNKTYIVSCGTFCDEVRANNIKHKLISKKFNATIKKTNGVYNVISGNFVDEKKAVEHMRAILSRGISCVVSSVNNY